MDVSAIPGDAVSIVNSVSVCVFVCLSVCPLTYLKTAGPSFTKFRYMLFVRLCHSVAVAWSFSDSSEIRYVMYFRFCV